MRVLHFSLRSDICNPATLLKLMRVEVQDKAFGYFVC
jgi:hypothetical protein